MKINTNVQSLSTQRVLGQTGAKVAQQMGRLSSGFRINKAADDAAGLGIANKFRADLRGLRQAARNAEQATSLLQVAEGAAQTVGGILDRMKELATQAASDNVSDRTEINREFTALRDEITRITSTTVFGSQKLLNGSLGNAIAGGSEIASGSSAAVAAGLESISLNGAAAGTYTVAKVDNDTMSVSRGGITQALDVTNSARQLLNFTSHGISIQTNSDFDIHDNGGSADGATMTYLAAAGTDSITVAGGNASFLVSSSGEAASYSTDKISLDTLDLTVATLGLNDDDLTSNVNASTALDAIDTAITSVNTVLGKIGAAQNRFDYATQNVKASIENLSAAESTIRDADMAAEMAEFTKQQILQQAGTAMLAQANSAPQQVLSLIRG
jgi:flagellin